MIKHYAALAAASVLGFVSASALADDAWRPTPTEQAKLSLQQQLRAGDSLDEVMDRARLFFFGADIDGGGVSESDLQLQLQIARAGARSREIANWLAKDLNGDGDVTRAELESLFRARAQQPIMSDGVSLIPTEAQIAEKLEKLVAAAMKSDPNGDNVIDRSEIEGLGELQAVKHARADLRNAVPLTLDVDGDGTVTQGEFLDALREALREVDSDGDELISSSELKDFTQENSELYRAARQRKQARQEEERLREAAVACAVPKASDADQLVLLATTEGRALSTVSLGGDDEEVTVVDVVIEPGRKPLYVLLTASGAVIWRFSGSVDRISTLVPNAAHHGTGDGPRVGVVGVAEGQIYIPKSAGCLNSFYELGGRRADLAVQTLPALVGRSADIVRAKQGISRVHLPSGKFERDVAYPNAVEPPEAGSALAMWNEMLRYNPGGLVEIDPDSVVSRVKAKRYSVLPQEAGLVQLLEEGAIEVIGTIKVVEAFEGFGPRIVLREDHELSPDQRSKVTLIPEKFLVLRKIRLPGGLAGAHAVTFVLADGVPMPEGSAGHSTITRQGE